MSDNSSVSRPLTMTAAREAAIREHFNAHGHIGGACPQLLIELDASRAALDSSEQTVAELRALDEQVDTKVEKIQKIVDLYFMPWGAAKAAMWEELAGDGPFNDARALRLIDDILHPESTKEKSPARQMA